MLSTKRTGGSRVRKRRVSKRPQRAQNQSTPFAALLDVSFSDNLIYWTRLLEINLNRAFAVKTGKEGLSVAEWRILAWLIEKGSLTVGDLVKYTHMERTVLGRVLDRMITKGLLVRRSGADARVSLNYVSSKGRKVFRKFQSHRDAVYRCAVQGIAADRIASALAVLSTMVRNLIESPSPNRMQ